MTDVSDEQERIRSAAYGQTGWGEWGSVIEHSRYVMRITDRGGRRKCRCGCGGRETHTGFVNGLAMTGGCELSARRWARGVAVARGD